MSDLKIKMFNLFFLCIFLFGSTFGQQEGEPCIDQYTNTAGRCTVAHQCKSAKTDFELNGIRPTFCSYAINNALVCCRGSNIPHDQDQRPGWGNASEGRRVSEEKCEEYTRSVRQKSMARCNYTGVEILRGEIANLGEFPHMAAIGWADFDGSYKFSCGGSLISPRFVVTAGHCTRNRNAQNPEPVIVRLGDQNIDSKVNDSASPIDIPIRKIHKHPDYRPPRSYDDISLLELATDVELTAAVRPACLWTKQDFGGHDKVIATGWSVIDMRTGEGEVVKELQKVSLSLLENSLCEPLLLASRKQNWLGLRSSQMCAIELKGGQDTCQVASGSPLQVASKDNSCIFHVVGVTSFGRKCAESGRPAVYTRIASYVDWIEKVVWPGD